MNVLFRLRSGKKDTGTLYCRITLNGQRANEFSVHQKVSVKDWHQETQTVKGKNNKAINDYLRATENQIREILNDFLAKGIVPTAETLRDKYLSGQNYKQPQKLSVWLEKYLEHAEVHKVRAPRTYQTYVTFVNRANKYLHARNTDPYVNDVNALFLDTMFAHLIKHFKLSRDTAARQMNFILSVLKLAQKYEEIDRLPQVKYERENRSAKNPLTGSQLYKLTQFNSPNKSLIIARDFFLISAYTGMLPSELDIFLLSPQKYLVYSVKRQATISVFPRIKTRNSSGSHVIGIYYTKAAEIIAKYPSGVRWWHSHQDMNRSLKIISEITGIQPGHLVLKNARSTYSTLLYQEFNSTVVSKLLGHTNTRITHKHYLNTVLEKEIDDLF